MEKYIIIVGYPYDKNSGGRSMIPQLVKTINKLYHKPILYYYIIFLPPINDEEERNRYMNTFNEEYFPIAQPYMIEDKNNIIIYPEDIYIPNPLNFKNIVRFNFYFNINEPSFDNEYNIFFIKSFHKLYNYVREIYGVRPIYNYKYFDKYINYLPNLDEVLNKCKNFNQEREYSCYIIRKGQNIPHKREHTNYHPDNSYLILYEQCNIDDLVIIFNKYKFFYSYDAFTFLLQIASLCGCIPIIVPFTNFKSISDFIDHEYYINGIAYGDKSEEIEHAISTKDNLLNSLISLKNVNYDNIIIDLINGIYTHFEKIDDEYEKLENILLSNKNNNKDELIILVYINTFNIDNNKILILTDKFNKNNFDYSNFDITYSNNIDENKILINSHNFNYIFSENIIINNNYRFKTHFYLNYENKIYHGDIIKLYPYKYNPTKFIHDVPLQTYIKNNINYNFKIPDVIYDYRPNLGKSKIIWAPSWDNISNNHWIIQSINNIGFNYYKRDTNLVDVVHTNNPSMINNYINDINNNLNICIYQENDGNLLNMINTVYINWFFDPFRNTSEYQNDALYLYQFPFYSFKKNVLRQRYNLPININNINEYPNCFPLCFNINQFNELLENPEKYNYKRNKTCYVLRKTADSHTTKMINSIKDYFIHPDDSICIDNFSLDESINIFLECDKFYCYDNVSFLAVISVLFGCQTILNSNYPGFKDIREIYKIYSPWMYYGMAYSNNLEDLEFAKNTKYILIDILKKINKNEYKNFFSEEVNSESILTFLKYLECYFSISF